jgi:hypothetical protein
VLLGVLSRNASSQGDGFAIRSALVAVTDEQGALIEGLGNKDFQVLERGVERDVIEVLTEEKSSELYFLVDSSVAFRIHRSLLRNGVEAFIDAVGGRYQVTLYEFGGRPKLLAGPTTDRAALQSAAGKIIARNEGAYLLDAITETAGKIDESEREEGKSVIVVILTALEPELSHTHYTRAKKAGKESGAVYYAVVYDNASSATNYTKRGQIEDVLNTITKESGGALTRVLTPTSLDGALTRLADEHLRSGYQVSFLTEITPRTQPEDLTISVDRPGARVELIQLLPGEKVVEETQP